MKGIEKKFRNQLTALRKEYVASLPRRVKKLEELAESLMVGHSSEAQLKSLYREVHNLKGSSGSFDFSTISEKSRFLHLYLQAIIEGGRPITTAQEDRIHVLVGEISTAVSRSGEDLEFLEKQSQVSRQKTTTSQNAENKLVYVIEKDPRQARDIALQVGFFGYKVQVFFDFDEVREAFAHQRPVMLLMTVEFWPGQSNLEDLKEEISCCKSHDVPVGILSSREDFQARLTAYRSGGDYFFVKPVDVKKLIDTLDDRASGKISKPYRVLIVDDDQNQADFHSFLLEQAGMTTATLTEQSRILEVINHFKPELILLDLYMPQCDGHELAMVLRQHPDHAGIPIIFLSTEQNFDKKIAVMAGQVEDFLTKPVKPWELTNLVELRVRRARRLGTLSSEVGSLFRELESLKLAIDRHAMVMFTDLTGQITYTNNSFNQLGHFESMELLGVNLKEEFPGQDFPDELWQTIDRGEIWQGEIKTTDREGTTWWLYTSVVPILGHDRKPFHYIWISNDISEYKTKESHLAEEQEESEASFRSKRDFLACMSHEMRTSLNGVMGMARILLDTNLSREQKEFARTIYSAGNHLVDVINEVLDYSKIEAGKLQLESTDMSVRSCVEKVAVLLAENAHKKNLEMIAYVDRQIPENILGDPLRLRQVLTNLSNNAIKFTETGQIQIRARLVSMIPEEACIQFEVSDTGIGISEELIPRLFQFFSQTEASTSRKYGGTGLGLAISARLVEAMGGEIQVESTPGMGSRFYFTCNFKRTPEVKPYIDPKFNKIYVLVISNQTAHREALAQQLESLGCRVDTMSAESIPRVITFLHDAFSEDPHEMVIFDLDDNEESCREFLRGILKKPYLNHLPLILSSTLPKLETARELVKEGFRSSFTRPAKLMNLYRNLVDAVGMKPQGESTLTGSLTGRILALFNKKNEHRILLVEDNPVNQKIAATLLEKAGFQCDVANNGMEAIEAYRNTVYDLVFMDCRMPEMDGFEATATIRRAEGKNRRVPIVAMTAQALGGDRERCLEAGMDDYLNKPIRPHKLYQMLVKYLGSEDPEILVDDTTSSRLKKRIGDDGESRADRAPVSMEQFETITNGDNGMGREIFKLFLVCINREMEALESALRESNAYLVMHKGHSIKGASSNIGAMTMAEIAESLERLGANGKLDSAHGFFASLKSEYGRVEKFLNQILGL